MYGALVSQHGSLAVATPLTAFAAVPEQGLAPLQKSLEATGAKLDEVVITGWAESRRPGDSDRVTSALGWKGAPPNGQARSVALRDRNGRQYILVRWTLTGSAVSAWQASVQSLQKAMKLAGESPMVTVQLGGNAPSDNLTELADRALGALAATDRQPWSDLRAASVAGHSTHLPPGPFGANVQVAVRHDAAKGHTRVWVAWPALLQEY